MAVEVYFDNCSHVWLRIEMKQFHGYSIECFDYINISEKCQDIGTISDWLFYLITFLFIDFQCSKSF